MAFFATLFACVVVISWPVALLMLYTMLGNKLRFVLQTLFILPIAMLNSCVCFTIGAVVKYLSFKLISPPLRIYLLCEITQLCWQYMLFTFEFWTNLRYVVSDDGVSDDIFHLNAMILANHSASPFDWISIASVADYLERFQNSFVFMKKEFSLVPGIGWVGSLNSAVPLQRDWSVDRVRIRELCENFAANKLYKLVTPWVWFSYPEGTRWTQKKFEAAQQFARERGYAVLSHLLQPRVKGFSYLTHHLRAVLGCIVDTTVLYHPRPPKPVDFFLHTRLCKYTHVHLRVFRDAQLPNADSDEDLSVYDEWLRERWTEKDAIMGRMKKGDIEYKTLQRSPWRAIRSYLAWTLFAVYGTTHLVLGTGTLTFLMVLEAAWFPVVIVCIENSQILGMDPKRIF